MGKAIYFHPFLCALYPVLFLFQHNIQEVRFHELINPVVFVLSSVAVIYALFVIIFKNFDKVALLVSLIVILIFSFGPLYAFGGMFFSKDVLPVVIPLLSLVILFACAAFLVKTKRFLVNVNKLLTQVAASLVVLTTVMIVYSSFQLKNVDKVESYSNTQTLTDSFQGNKPDVYYLIFDKYAGFETMETVYNFNNSELKDFFTNNNFYVASESNSNYLRTPQSLASSLNMNYLDKILTEGELSSADWTLLFNKVENNEVIDIFKTLGYKYIHFGSGWNATSNNPKADRNINVYPLPEFSALIYNTTLINPLSKILNITILDERQNNYNRITYQFQEIQEIPQDPEPTFTFAHFLVPHSPYIFNPDGSYVENSVENSRTEIENYINQVAFVNESMKKIVTTILNDSKNSPIIIIQSDEGPNPEVVNERFVDRETQLGFDWETASARDLKTKVGIINMLYFPDNDYSRLYPSISPVNTFRLIFNKYYGLNYDLLPDKTYTYKNYWYPYEFKDVSAFIQQVEIHD